MQAPPEKETFYLGLLSMTKGVLTGCNEKHEWMLKWWLTNYTKHNSYPVTFFDFGMSPSALNFCKSKGEVITIDKPPLENIYDPIGDVPWKKSFFNHQVSQRPIWFTKPFAFMKAPYKRNLWLDIDCEVKKPLESLINLPLGKAQFAIREYDPKATKHARKEGFVNSKGHCLTTGVTLFDKDSPLLQEWIEYIYKNYSREHSEDSALANLLTQKPFDIINFSEKYNYDNPEKTLPDTYIHHHMGTHQKRTLMQNMSFT